MRELVLSCACEETMETTSASARHLWGVGVSWAVANRDSRPNPLYSTCTEVVNHPPRTALLTAAERRHLGRRGER